ncbi:putative GTP-binding protein YjiA [Citrobacter koseri]|uniref:Putative GTP-binding protein YjiA n=1 Tax=Citrobacter koseri TaxID=545 RepID=A0A2X2VJX8_CITKO|nr:putative GTP-binding protein YjiA [Citrobacter koseri]
MVSATPRFHFIADKQNDISSIVVELDYPVDISDVSRVMENLLLESAEKLLRYKGMLWIEGEPNRLLFQGVQRLYSADWDRPWGDEQPHSTLVFIGIQLPEDEIRAAFAGLKEVTLILDCPVALRLLGRQINYVGRIRRSRHPALTPPPPTHSVITNRVAAKQLRMRWTRNTIVSVATSATVTEVMRYRSLNTRS